MVRKIQSYDSCYWGRYPANEDGSDDRSKLLCYNMDLKKLGKFPVIPLCLAACAAGASPVELDNIKYCKTCEFYKEEAKKTSFLTGL